MKITQAQERIILGIDPGTNLLGYAVIKVTNGNPTLLACGTVKFPVKDEQVRKLGAILISLNDLISNYLPDEMAIESPFFGNNIQSMLKLGRAQGVAIAAAIQKGLPVSEYAPRRVKQAVTGNGAAGKEQVAAMCQRLLKTDLSTLPLDATDAVSVALCHSMTMQDLSSQKAKGKGGWDAFVKSNPGKIKRS